MKTLVLANQKGGVGKTSTLVHLALHLAEFGKNVVVIDLDTQGNASYTLSEYSINIPISSFLLGESEMAPLKTMGLKLIPADSRLLSVEKVSLSDLKDKFTKILSWLEQQGCDYVLIDTAPALGVRLSAALAVGDFVLSPIELEVYSLQGIKLMLTTITNIRNQLNPKLKFIGMLPSRVDSRNPRHKKHLEELEAAYPSLIVPHSVGLRSSIADALAKKTAVWKIQKTAARAAAKEIQSMANYIMNKMEN